MKELSLHILDITQNSIKAQATVVFLNIVERTKENTLTIIIEDNGKGIAPEMLKNIADPFVTSRKTRKVGLGLSLFKAAACGCDGDFDIQSELGKGTKVMSSFKRDHIDRVPLGNMADTVMTMVMSFGETDLVYEHDFNDQSFVFDTREIKETLGVTSLNEMDILNWIRAFVLEGLEEIMEVE